MKMSKNRSKPKPAADPSSRQKLSKKTRNDVAKYQTATESSSNQPRYDLPFGLTADEKNSKFKNYAASFHKLFEHNPATGLLTDGNSANPKSGVDNYKKFLDGLMISTPNSDFNQNSFNNITLADDPPADPK